MEYSESVATVITGSEGASVHERWLRSCPQGYSPYLRDRFRIAALIPAIEYQRAQRVRALIRHGVEQAFKRVDVLVTPTTPFPAPRIGQKSITIRGREESLLSPTVGIMTRPFSLAGVPVVSVPCGFSGSGLPVGMSIIGPHFGEQKVLPSGLRPRAGRRMAQKKTPIIRNDSSVKPDRPGCVISPDSPPSVVGTA